MQAANNGINNTSYSTVVDAPGEQGGLCDLERPSQQSLKQTIKQAIKPQWDTRAATYRWHHFRGCTLKQAPVTRPHWHLSVVAAAAVAPVPAVLRVLS